MSLTSIEWTDMVWNPVTGCSKVSQGCKNCYAERVFPRAYGTMRWGGRKFTDVRCHPERLDQPLHWKKPRRIFVNSMSDLFHEDVNPDFILRVFDVMLHAPQHTFQILTKRPQRMFTFIDDLGFNGRNFVFNEGQVYKPLANVWLGVSVEDQPTFDERWPYVRDTPAAVRFISYEPALGPVDLSKFQPFCRAFKDYRAARGIMAGSINWVIAGGESGPNARSCNVDWIRSVIAQCKAAGVAVFVKQLGSRSVATDGIEGAVSHWPLAIKDRNGRDQNEWPDDLRVRQFPT